MADPQKELKDLKPTIEFFIGIDSDGCAFDTMEVKQKECFCPATIKHFHLAAVSKYAREVYEFVNLYSKERGLNRFLALVSVLAQLRDRKEVRDRRVDIETPERLEQWIREETKLSNPVFKKKVAETGDKTLAQVLAWSEEINARIADIVRNVPPFPYVKGTLEKAKDRADMIVVSQTPIEALAREWQEHNIDKFMRAVAGQEYGTKTEHLALAAGGKYPSEKILMIGDAPGDLKAATANGALFYPILPGREEESWKRFHDEALDKFFKGAYKGAYENALIDEFDKALPEKPTW
jgi:phosphoglycolate phosphatase-like HAD superfamily hydrolase